MNDPPRYQPCYCEENAWHLCDEPALGPGRRWVVFVSNPARTVAFAAHRAAVERGGVVIWDYHVVVMVARDDGELRVWDLDSTLGLDVPLPGWLEATFGVPPRFGPELAPRFRVVAAEAFRAGFRSDRSHMRREDGTWRAPPPAWPTIGPGGTNLDDYLDMEAPGPGVATDLAGLADALR